MIPKYVAFRDHLPMTSSGKVDYAKLRATAPDSRNDNLTANSELAE